MWVFRSLEPSDLITKKWRANFSNTETGKTKTVNFGARGYRDYTLIDNKAEANAARENYRSRHAGDNLSDPLSPGALSWWILWGPYRNVTQNLREYRKHFGI